MRFLFSVDSSGWDVGSEAERLRWSKHNMKDSCKLPKEFAMREEEGRAGPSPLSKSREQSSDGSGEGFSF